MTREAREKYRPALRAPRRCVKCPCDDPDEGELHLPADWRFSRSLLLCTFGTWLAVPTEATATLRRLGVPAHVHERVLTGIARTVIAHNTRIASARFPRG